MQVALDLSSFVDADDRKDHHDRLRISKLVPLEIKRWGFEMRLVLGGSGAAATATPDSALLKAVARGFRWFNEIASGAAGSAADIARREKLDKHLVSRLIPLAFLAPPIVEAIAQGTQPVELTTEMLTRGVNLPFDWPGQGQLLKMVR